MSSTDSATPGRGDGRERAAGHPDGPPPGPVARADGSDDPQRTIVFHHDGQRHDEERDEAGGGDAGPSIGPEPRLARYEILDVLGQGAMGVVYKARDRELERIVAIKTLRADGPGHSRAYAEERRRLCREAMAAARLSHPGIVAIYDVIIADEVPHVVMEYVRGRTLAELIAAGGLPVHDAVRLVQQVCRAIEYAHGEGVVHRDIKSSNILVDPSGAAKLGDFGVARIVDKPTAERAVVIGTPAYMAPEQLSGGGADRRSDLFSLGVVLYEAVTGQSPFPGDDIATVLYEITHGTPVAARDRNPSVSVHLDSVIRCALSKEPEDRFPDASAFGAALERALVVPGRWAAARERRLSPRLVWSAAATAAVLAVSATLGVVASRTMGKEDVVASAATIPAAIRSGLASGAVSGGTLMRVAAARSRAALEVGPAPARMPAATIVIETNPSVDVYVDGMLRGRTRDQALVVRDVPVGVREITLKLDDRERTLSGTLRNGQTLTLAYTFGESRPPAKPQPASAAPGSAPSLGPSPRDAVTTAHPLAPGKETVAAVRSMPAPAREPDGAEGDVAGAGDSFGCVSVNAVPFAAVYVDGRHVGDTPRACLRIRTGARSLRFQSAEGSSVERSIVVTAEHTRENPLRLSYDFHVRQFIGP